MVNVCDAIMGSGKTSATITYINEHPEERFIYFTPYLDEADRIIAACPDADFATPSSSNPRYGFSKTTHTAELVRQRRNIATTHQALMNYTPEMYAELKEAGYTVIIDETLAVLNEDQTVSRDDVNLLLWSGCIEETAPREYSITERGRAYRDGALLSLIKKLSSRSMIVTGSETTMRSYYWEFSPLLFESAKNVFVLTYLFEGSEMSLFFRINGIEYRSIGIDHPDKNTYRFCDHPNYIPKYVARLSKMIEVEEKERMNEVGRRKTALSMNWYQSHPDEVDTLRKNLYTFFCNHHRGTPVATRMCGTFKAHWGKIRAKGYWNSDTAFSMRSTNEYADKTILAYPVNIYANAGIVRFYQSLGQEFDNDNYALSIMIQWIWRSAIRNGQPISLYLPSRRMRELLYKWIDDTQKEYKERYRKES